MKTVALCDSYQPNQMVHCTINLLVGSNYKVFPQYGVGKIK